MAHHENGPPFAIMTNSNGAPMILGFVHPQWKWLLSMVAGAIRYLIRYLP